MKIEIETEEYYGYCFDHDVFHGPENPCFRHYIDETIQDRLEYWESDYEENQDDANHIWEKTQKLILNLRKIWNDTDVSDQAPGVCSEMEDDLLVIDDLSAEIRARGFE